jgi:hypothetical protein
MNDLEVLQLIQASAVLGIIAVLVTALGRLPPKADAAARERTVVLLGVYPSIPILLPLLLGLDHPLTLLHFVAGIIGLGGIIEYSLMDPQAASDDRLKRVLGFILVGLLAAGCGIALLVIAHLDRPAHLHLTAMVALLAGIGAGCLATVRLHSLLRHGGKEQDSNP